MDAEYILDTPTVRTFVAQVRAELADAPPQAALEALRPAFAALLADQEWLPDTYRQPAPESGMGGGIATWLIYRAAGGELSLFSLVVPAGSATPVHDHLAWGLVGLYAGEQDERVYKRVQGGAGAAPLELAERNHLHPGDFYVLMPPEGDIHSVATLSEAPSVSIHLLGNDTGCVWRHAYTPENGGIRAFRSGWSNVECHDPAL
jgi:predicted metal-dependent enzyme (double-stranded beta helix superfamily)